MYADILIKNNHRSNNLTTPGTWRYKSWAALAFLLFAGLPAHAQQITFTKVVDTNTPIPGGTGNFTQLGNRPSIDGNDVAFTASGSGQNGIYTFIDGSLALVVDRNSQVPDHMGSPVNFSGVGNQTISSGDVAFVGIANLNSFNEGIYANTGGILHAIANADASVPGGTGNFFSLSNPSLAKDKIVFEGHELNAIDGVYSASAAGGPISLIADENTAVPNGIGTFTHTSGSSFDGTSVVFFGIDSAPSPANKGIYSNRQGPLDVVADYVTAIPCGIGDFTSFRSLGPVIDNGTIAFQGSGTDSQSGVYLANGNTLSLLADENTPVPGGSTLFFGFNNDLSIAGSHVAFSGSSTKSGLYIKRGPVLEKILDTNDMLDGKAIASSLTMGEQALSGKALVFFVSFDDSSKGIYLAQFDRIFAGDFESASNSCPTG